MTNEPRGIYFIFFQEVPTEVFWKSDAQQRKLLVVYEEEKPYQINLDKPAYLAEGLNKAKNDLYFARNEQKVNMLRLLKFK